MNIWIYLRPLKDKYAANIQMTKLSIASTYGCIVEGEFCVLNELKHFVFLNFQQKLIYFQKKKSFACY